MPRETERHREDEREKRKFMMKKKRSQHNIYLGLALGITWIQKTLKPGWGVKKKLPIKNDDKKQRNKRIKKCVDN